MADLPSGTVTFLFTDIEGSTRLWEREREAMAAAVSRHLALLRDGVETHGGVLFKTVGDAVQAAFPVAPQALAAAVAAQTALQAEPWPESPGPLRVRMALHTGVGHPENGDYLAAPLNRVARLLAVGHGGQILLTQAVHQLVRDDLPADVTVRDLGAHRLRDLLEPEAIFQAVAPGLEEQFPPLRSLPSHPTNLTALPTSLIGREEQIAAVLRLFDEGVRLVTLTGPGGTGKTRLAQEIAVELLDRYPDGVFFVDLAPVRDPELAGSSIANALGARDLAGAGWWKTVAAYVSQKQLLLVLDNLEQVLEVAPEIATLIALGPQLAVLATSREALHVRAERELPISPLPLPGGNPSVSVAELAAVPSVALFVARAQASDPSFVLTQENAPAVAAICRRLDGLPLAIELAAARARLLPPEALLARLERALPLLTGGARDAPERQRTLRDTIGWSYDLLQPGELALFRRLSVFVGGFTLEAAEEVAGQDGDVNVLGGLGSLVERNLVRRTEGVGGAPRFGLLETIREFGLERLQESGEEGAIRDRHARYVHKSTDRFRYEIEGPQRAAAQASMRLDLDNIRAALTWAISRQDGISAQGIAGGLGPFWMDNGLIAEGREWIEKSLPLPDPEARVAPEALYWGGYFAIFQSDLKRAEALGHDALARSRSTDNTFGEASALFLLGGVTLEHGDLDQTEKQFVEALRLFQSLKELPSALAMTGVVLDALGDLAIEQGDMVEARRRFEESLAYWRSLDNLWGVPKGLANLANMALRGGDITNALTLYREILARQQEQHDRFEFAGILHNMGEALLISGRPRDAARLLGAAKRMEADIGLIMSSDAQMDSDALNARVRDSLGEDQFIAAWDAGRALDYEAAVAEAIALTDDVLKSTLGET